MDMSMLPIGTVVKLKNGQFFMIGGYYPKGSPVKGHIYDYSAFLYPAGYTGNLDVFQFDMDQIEEVIALGYQDKEQLDFYRQYKRERGE